MPGARLTSEPKNGLAEGQVNVKLGPITSAFAGLAQVTRDEEAYRGFVRGAGRDAKSASRARAVISYQVEAIDDRSSKVDVSVKFLLAGALAQFSRMGLVKDVADNLTQTFARNLEARLSGAPEIEEDAALDASAVARAALWGRILAFIRKLFGQ